VICESDRPRFELISANTRRLLSSKVVEAFVILLAYGTVIVLIREVAPATIPAWHMLTKEYLSFSWTGWWHVLVSISVTLILLFGWLWRLLLWNLFLWSVPSRFASGAGPSGSVRRAAVRRRIARRISDAHFALGAVVAGGVANRVVHHGMLGLPIWSFPTSPMAS
jgi:hypothetical protein